MNSARVSLPINCCLPVQLLLPSYSSPPSDSLLVLQGGASREVTLACLLALYVIENVSLFPSEMQFSLLTSWSDSFFLA